MKLNKSTLIFLVIFIFSATLRLVRFPQVPLSLFSDEVDIGYQTLSFRETGRDYFGNFLPLQFRSFSDIRTSLPIYATILVSYLPGVSLELAIRLTPLLFSLANLFLIYYFINALWARFNLPKSKNHLLPGHFAVFSLALTPWHFTYSRTAFELSQLFFFNLLGFYLFLRFQKNRRLKTLILSLLVLGLTPLIYSTAKLAILGDPVILWLLADPGSLKLILKNWYLSLILFTPLVVVILSGGAGQRFKEISIFTDPTLSSEINYVRQTDLGPNLIVGSTPNFLTKIVHNKASLVASRFLSNSIKPISATFLFLAGDPNLRHAVPNRGMLLKSFLVVFAFGLFALFSQYSKNFTLTLLALTILAIVPAAVTRDGADHSSRLFMLLLPLVILLTLGWSFLSRYRLLTLVLLGITLFESFFYFHDYFLHYPYLAETQFHYGLKELVTKAQDEKTLAIISPKYEPPLIFYLFYNRFPPAKFQSLIKSNKLYHPISNDLNLEGYQIGDDPVYIASIRNFNAKVLFPASGAYYITSMEAAAIYGHKIQEMTPDIKAPSGLPLFYRLEIKTTTN